MKFAQDIVLAPVITENSMAGKGSNLVEIVSTCNSGWKQTPAQSNKWMEEHMFKEYPKGDLKDTTNL